MLAALLCFWSFQDSHRLITFIKAALKYYSPSVGGIHAICNVWEHIKRDDVLMQFSQTNSRYSEFSSIYLSLMGAIFSILRKISFASR